MRRPSPVRFIGSFILGICFASAPSLRAATLVSEYRFENNLSDSSANAYTATGGIGFSNTLFKEGAFSGTFDGTNYAAVTDASAPLQSFTGSFSLAAWVYMTAESTSQNAIVAKWGSSAGQRGYFLIYDNASNKIQFGISDDGTSTASHVTTLSSTNTVALNTWHHLAAVYSQNGASSSMTIYINGMQDNSIGSGVMQSVFNANNPLTIGSFFNNAASAKMQGQIDDVRLYNGALTGSEVAALVPEPSAAGLFLGGILSLCYLRKKRYTQLW